MLLLQDRGILVSFKGARHDLPTSHPAYPRNSLSLIHNGDDIIMATYCAFQTRECKDGNVTVLTTGPQQYIDKCLNDTTYSNTVAFEWLLLESKFTIILPGEGLHSYRLMEAMSVSEFADTAATLLKFTTCVCVTCRRARFR